MPHFAHFPRPGESDPTHMSSALSAKNWKCTLYRLTPSPQTSVKISTECWFWMATICCLSINKMGQLYRMLILKACPYQQIVSSNRTETTNGTAPICWSARWVNHPDWRFCPHFDISCHSETTKWVARPIWEALCIGNIFIRLHALSTLLENLWKTHLIFCAHRHWWRGEKKKQWTRFKFSNFLMPVNLIVCRCSFCFSPKFLFRQYTARLHECKSGTINHPPTGYDWQRWVLSHLKMFHIDLEENSYASYVTSFVHNLQLKFVSSYVALGWNGNFCFHLSKNFSKRLRVVAI